MNKMQKTKDFRSYNKDESCIFKKNNEEFGGFSNMATVYPIVINGISIRTSEALYQACKFPHLPDVQEAILNERSPMQVKMISRKYNKKSREDWNNIRTKVMDYCIRVKLAQNYIEFGNLFKLSGQKNIVENSSKDNFWGAIPNETQNVYTGVNALGRLLMKLRQDFFSSDCFSLLYVEPIEVENFFLLGLPIRSIDERSNFIKHLEYYWYDKKNLDISLHSREKEKASVETTTLNKPLSKNKKRTKPGELLLNF